MRALNVVMQQIQNAWQSGFIFKESQKPTKQNIIMKKNPNFISFISFKNREWMGSHIYYWQNDRVKLQQHQTRLRVAKENQPYVCILNAQAETWTVIYT